MELLRLICFPSLPPLCQVLALADAAEENRACSVQAFSRLRSATHLLILLVSLWQGLGSDQTTILEATLLPLLQDTPQLVSGHTCIYVDQREISSTVVQY